MLGKIYNTKYLKGDITGGLVAGVIALPLALAFGVQSGLGAEAGLYGAIAVGIFAALFGGTETQASGPTGPMTVVSAALATGAIGIMGDLPSAMGLIIAAFFLGGLLQVAFGFMNIASYVRYFPYPVISGFMSGVGLIIVILQIFPFFGFDPADSPKKTLDVIKSLGSIGEGFNWQALVIGLITVAVYYIFPKITKVIPSALAALVIATLVGVFLKWDIPVIGEIGKELPKIQLGQAFSIDFGKHISFILEYGVVLAVLGSIDSLLTSVIADNMTKTKHNSNRELIGQGIGNMLAAAIGGIPGAGATKGTVVNINAGGRTRLSGALHGLLLLAVLLGLGRYASQIPHAVLAGLLIPIGFKIIDFKGLKHLLRVPRADAFIMILVLLLTTFGSLIQAVGIGVTLACLLFMKKSSDLGKEKSAVETLADVAGEKENLWEDEKEFFDEYKDRLVIKHLYGPLFFGFTSHFKDQIKNLSPDIKALIIRMDRVPYIDQSGLYALEDSILELRQKNVEVLLTGLQEQPYDQLKSIDIIPNLVPEDDIFEKVKDAFDYLKEKK